MATVRTPRTAWIDAGLSALAAGGPDAVRVEALAAGLGVTKGGFYWHFSGREALIADMLDTWEQAGTEDVIARVDGAVSDPRARVRQLFELAPSADQVFAVELALRDWARRDPDVAKRLRRVDRRRLKYLRSLFAQFCANDDDAEARSMLAYSLFIGGSFIASQRAGRSRSQVLHLAVEHLLT